MPIEGVAIIPRCAECDALWLPADEDRWSAYLTDDEPRRKNLAPSERTGGVAYE
jgi:hypothetical protein